MKCKASWLLAGIVLAGVSTLAMAAKPELTLKQKQELAAQAKQKTPAFRATQPQTAGQAKATLRRIDGGGTAIRVPTELWNTLGAQQDAPNAPIRIVESDGTGAPATEGQPHE